MFWLGICLNKIKFIKTGTTVKTSVMGIFSDTLTIEVDIGGTDSHQGVSSVV